MKMSKTNQKCCLGLLAVICLVTGMILYNAKSCQKNRISASVSEQPRQQLSSSDGLQETVF